MHVTRRLRRTYFTFRMQASEALLLLHGGGPRISHAHTHLHTHLHHAYARRCRHRFACSSCADCSYSAPKYHTVVAQSIPCATSRVHPVRGHVRVVVGRLGPVAQNVGLADSNLHVPVRDACPIEASVMSCHFDMANSLKLMPPSPWN